MTAEPALTADPSGRAISARRTRRRRWLLAGLITLVLVVAIGPRAGDGPPLDPRSAGPAGVKGLLDVLDRLGAAVDIAAATPDADVDVALVIIDRMDKRQRDELLGWVRDGGLLVVADPDSTLAPGLGGLTSIGFTEPTIEPSCEDPAVSSVARVAIADGRVFELPEGAAGCFPRSGGHWMVRQDVGQGQQVTLGGPFTLTNALLDDADTAVFLVNLLAPSQGGRVQVISGRDPDQGIDTLGDILPDQVGLALFQLLPAWLALLWWRGRRHGRPVGEQPPVRLDASDTTVAVGNLLQRANLATDAALILRGHLVELLRTRLGLQPMDPETLAVLAAERAGADLDDLRRLLAQQLPADDASLLAYANLVGRVQQRIIAGPSEAPDPGPSTPPNLQPTPE